MKALSLAFLIALLAAVPVSAQDDLLILSALVHCLNARMDNGLPTSDPKSVPPGLIPGRNVSVAMLHGNTGRAFSYQRTEPRVISCGVAMYGPVPAYTQQAVSKMIEESGRWKSASPDSWKLSVDPADKSYWGDPRAPGLTGVMMLTRQPSPDAPTLEVEYHTVLIP